MMARINCGASSKMNFPLVWNILLESALPANLGTKNWVILLLGIVYTLKGEIESIISPNAKHSSKCAILKNLLNSSVEYLLLIVGAL